MREKIPNWRSVDWRLRMGDCIYDYSNILYPIIRKGVHKEINRDRDLNGINSLISNEFYYFGEEARPIPLDLKYIIKINQGHKIIDNKDLVSKFEDWIRQFESNKVYANPQLRWKFERKLNNLSTIITPIEL